MSGTRPSPEDHRRLLDERLAREVVAPAHWSGRGIVIPAGGPKYFPCAWVSIRLLRELGCTLPIELWHLGPGELGPAERALVEPWGVRVVDAFEVRRRHPMLRLNGWELKPFALLHSGFEQALLLDADNVPAVDPSYLFDSSEFARTGVVFWPDRWRKPGDPHRHLQPEAWSVCGLSPRNEPECESGQVLIDKRRCHRALRVALHLNEHSEYYYRYFYGDKDTYRVGCRLCDTPYTIVPVPVASTPGAEIFYQHDFEGKVVFQHRLVKWRLDGPNFRDPRFRHEARCLELLRELGARRTSALSPTAARIAAQRFYTYRRVGYDARVMELCANGRIGHGRARLELEWRLDEADPRAPALLLLGEEGLICRLEASADGAFRGRWTKFERMPIELSPRSGATS